VLDAIAFQGLREMVNNNAVLAKVMDSYLQETPKLLQTMRNALSRSLNAGTVAQKDAAALNSAAHSLKSTSATFGATNLAQLCKELEASAGTSTLEATAAMVSQVETEYEKVKTALLQERRHLNST
jgi:HPt (histidine-containing phosphotransfer) domain-containing protein